MATVVTLLLAGVALLALETVLPGLVAGSVGLLCLLAGIIFAYANLGPAAGHTTLVIVAAILVVGTILWFRFFPRSRFGRRFVSQGTSGNIGTEQPELLHLQGTALSNLRPSGLALIDGRRIDVVSEGAMITAGSPIRVVAVEGFRVVVRSIEE